MEKLIGKQIYINGNGNKKKGPDTVLGTLLDVKEDFIVVLTDEGAKYIRRDHIKTISEDFNNNSNNQSSDNFNDYEIYEADSFHELLRKSRYKYCLVSSGGPNNVKGIIESVDDDFINIVSEKAYVQIPLFHVRSIDFTIQNKNQDNKHDDNKKK